jgi:photosystem II stability/assembly factor-like uncharacterized protein
MQNYGPIISVSASGMGALFSPQMGGLFFTPDFCRTWSRTPIPAGYYLTDISIGDSGFGLAAGYRGLLSTVDFGATWQPVATDAPPVSVVSNGVVGCAACAGGVLYVTSDCGATWRRAGCYLNGVPAGVRYGSANRCYLLLTAIIPDPAVPEDQIRDKAYQLWQRRQSFAAFNPGPFDSVDSASDWVVAQRLLSTRWMLLYSDDAWRTWRRDDGLRGARPLAFDVHGETVVVLAEDNTISWRTAPDAPWKSGPLPFDNAPCSVSAASDSVWLCPAGCNIGRTADAGSRWDTVAPRGLNLIGGTCFVSETRGFTTSGNYSGTFTVGETTDAGVTWSLVTAYQPRS